MASIDRLVWADGLAFSIFGLDVGIRVSHASILPRLLDVLPSGWKPARSPRVDRLYSVVVGGTPPGSPVRRYHLLYGDAARLVRGMDAEQLIAGLEDDLQAYLAQFAQRGIFVHAGVVGWRGRAIVLPGDSRVGKTTLVSALLAAGATYYSDECAVFAADGRVRAFPNRLTLRTVEGLPRRRASPGELGARTGRRPLPVGLVAFTRYREGARWRPRPVSAGGAALALLRHAAAPRRQPELLLSTVANVVRDARLLRGSRGEAARAAEQLLRQLDRA